MVPTQHSERMIEHGSALVSFVFFGEEVAEAIEFAFPLRAVCTCPVFERAETSWLNATGADAAQFFSVHQANFLQNLQVLSDRRKRDAERLGETRYRCGAVYEPVQDGPSRGIAERMKQAVDINGRRLH